MRQPVLRRRPGPVGASGRTPGARRGPLVSAVLVVALALAGCGTDGDDSATAPTPTSAPTGTPLPDPAADVTNGVDERPADEVLDEAVESLLAQGSYRVAGSPTAGAPLDLVFVTGATLTRPSATDDADEENGRVGRGVRGTLSLDGSTFELIAVDDAVYVRGNLDWLASVVAEDARRTLGEKWLLLPPGAADQLGTVTDPEAFARALLEPPGAVQSVGVALIDEQPALGIRYVDSGATAWIAGTGPVLPLLVERVGATATDGVLSFSEFGADAELAPPAADQVVVVPSTAADAP